MLALRQLRALSTFASRGARVMGVDASAQAEHVSAESLAAASAAGLSATVGDLIKEKHTALGSSAKSLCVKENDTVLEAVRKMTSMNVGALVVMDCGNQLRGIVTERDYLHKIVVLGRTSKDTKVGDIMTRSNKLVTVEPDTPVYAAMQLMTKKRFRHVPVVDFGAWADGKIVKSELVGMVSIGDCVQSVVSELGEQMTAMEQYIAGSY